ncbi:hypothetical protein [Paraburkholderia sp. J12]|uniref:hypothetical protein n=1 Tax=Paraburkholderia sp. J12 TaxID=2805432 RepID=UPI002ABE73B6|nr:hypothetical protein [Paraburkholderia sp. J12]
MGTISKHVAKNGDVTYQGEVRRKGFPTQSKTFVEKKDCEKWIRAAEAALDRGEVSDPIEGPEAARGRIKHSRGRSAPVSG